MVFPRLGLVAEYGSAWLLPRLVGYSRSLDLLLSGRVVLGEEAFRIGLVDFLAEPVTIVERAVAFARQLVEGSSPTSMAVIKGQLLRALDQTFDEAVADSDIEMRASFRRPDIGEGVASLRARRSPAFPALDGAAVR